MPTILIAGDRADIGTVLADTLRRRGHQVVVANGAAAAFSLAAQVVPELVVLDVTTPSFNGMQLARRLRSSPETARITILFLTAEGGESQTLAMFSAGADDYLVKPFNPTELALRTEALLARRTSGASGSLPPDQGFLIAVAGPKGGCGRTTVAVSVGLAIAAARRNARDAYLQGMTFLLDGHLTQGDVDVHLDLRSNRTARDLVTQASHLNAAVVEQAMVTHRSGLRVLLRPRAVGESESISPQLWQQLLQLAATMAETVVVDLGPTYDDEQTLATLQAASAVLVVLTPEIGSVRNGRDFLNLAPQLRLERSRFWPVLNRAHDRAHLTARDVATALGVELASLTVLPEGGPSAVGRINRGLPIVEDQRSPLGRALERLAHSLLPSPPARDATPRVT